MTRREAAALLATMNAEAVAAGHDSMDAQVLASIRFRQEVSRRIAGGRAPVSLGVNRNFS